MPAPPDRALTRQPRPEGGAAGNSGGDKTPRVDAILAGATAAFSEKGFAATSMRQIAKATDTSLGAIYYHFDSKESILHAILASNFRRVRESLEERLEGLDDPHAAFEVFVTNHIEFFARHLDEMRVMSHELDTLTGEAGDDVAALRRAYTECARAILSGLRPDMDADELQVALLCLFGTLNWTYRWFHTLDPTVAPADLARQMSSLFLQGYLPR